MFLETVLLALIGIIAYLSLRTSRKMPPGPTGIPGLGSYPALYLDQAEKLKTKYGKLVTVRLGAIRFVYIFDYKLSKDALSRLEFSARPSWSSFMLFDEEIEHQKSGGIVFSNGMEWHHTRRFLLRHLRDLGMGKSRMEVIIQREAENLVDSFKPLVGRPATKLPFSINVCVLNVIWQLVASHRYDYSDKKVEEFMTMVNELQDSTISAAVKDFFPFLKNLVPENVLNYITNRKVLKKIAMDFQNIFQPFLDEHTEKLDSNNPRDLMDDYLLEMNEKKSEELSHFSKIDFMRNAFDLFVAGNDTTASLICWVLIYMAKYPQIQKKVQEEIDKVVPTDKTPGLEHREKLAYLDATINETQRLASFAAFGVFRSVLSDGGLDGYFIPKDSVIFPVVGLIHKDPTYWKNPDEFDPSRFIDANGKCISTCNGFLPFGIGKRQCLGENFARMELYLFVGALLQKFTFSPPEGKEIDLKPMNIELFQRPNREQLFNIKLRK